MYVGNFFTTFFGPKGLSSGNTYIKITKNGYWVLNGLCINWISFLIPVALLKGTLGCVYISFVLHIL
jgi:hypothetical protein